VLLSRSSTCPNIDRFDTSTFVLAGFWLPANSTSEPVSVVYHCPAPSIVTLFTLSGELTW
jgi:hypothetical protein